MKMIKFCKPLTFFLISSCHCYGVLSQQTSAALRHQLSRSVSAKAKADICFNLSRKYADGLKIDSALYFADKIKEYSRKENYEAGLGKYHLALSFAYYYRGLNDKSTENVLKAIKILTSQKNDPCLGIAYWQLGTLEHVEGNKNLSRKNYWASVHFLSLGKDTGNLFRTYFWLARSYKETSDYDSAANYFIKALRLAEVMKDKFKIYTAAVGLGQAFLNLHNVPKAYQYLDWGLKNKTPTANKVGLWEEIGNYATCLSLLHNFSKADSAIREFELMSKQFNHVWGWITLDKLKGIQEYEKQNYAQALNYLRNACSKIDLIAVNKADIKEIVFNLARTEFKMRQYDSAIAHLKYAAELSGSIKNYVDAIEANLLLSESYGKINKPDSALYYFRRYSDLKESVFSLEKQRMIAEVTTRYESEKKEQEIKILQKESEANAYLLQLRNQEIEKQQLANEKKSQQLKLISQQNEINKLDAYQKTLGLDNVKKENEKNQAKLKMMAQEAGYQKLLAEKHSQQNKLALIAIASILLLSGYGLYRYRQNRQLSKQLARSLAELRLAQEQLIRSEKEKEAENLRLRISRDIHDEVGATLSGVALFSEIAKEKMQQHHQQDAQQYLEYISSNSKEMVERMSDIVWAINPENDSIERIIEKLRGYAFNLCAGKNISLHIHIDGKLKQYHPSMQIKRNLYLFIKEAVNNAIKYSEGKNILLSLQLENESVILEIKDDGKGFNPEANYQGNGLLNMKARAASLNARLNIDSQNGNGTAVRLRFDFHPIEGQTETV